MKNALILGALIIAVALSAVAQQPVTGREYYQKLARARAILDGASDVCFRDSSDTYGTFSLLFRDGQRRITMRYAYLRGVKVGTELLMSVGPDVYSGTFYPEGGGAIGVYYGSMKDFGQCMSIPEVK